jgi:L,D-transpeptidase-like protein
LTRWSLVGGEDVVGPPLSEERFDEDANGVVQTFAGLTLVYDPAQAPPWDVHGKPLSREEQEAAAPRRARTRVAGCSGAVACRFFPETGHTLSGRFLDYWASSGDLPIFGLPVSEPFAEGDATVQVFERAVLEDDGGRGITLRPVAAAEAEAEDLIGDPAFQPAPPTGGTAFLVSASDGLRLRAGPSLEAAMIVVLPENAEFIAAPGNMGEWVPGYADGYAGWVAREYLRDAPPLPALPRADWNPDRWQGAALGETNVRAEPTTASRMVDELAYGDPVTVEAWVKGEEVFEGADLWAKVGANRYVYARNIGRNAPVLPPPLPPDAPTFGRWIDVDLTQQIMTAYDGRQPVRVVETTTGMAGWETPPGYYQILNRVANETMTSGAIGAEHHFKLEDVLFTQYFTDRGHAIHFAWWRTEETIGRPGSHGCLNLLLDDARFFWDWATYGTPVYVHP